MSPNNIVMGWIIGAIPGIVLLAVLFVLLTDGRYFGKKLMYRVYDRFGATIFSARSEVAQWRELVDQLPLRGDEAVLDVGTAVGDLPLTIASMPGFHGRAVGVDWSPRMMAAAQAEARRRGVDGRATFRVVDAREALPFATGEFDVVFCFGLLETLPGPEQILAELARVLKPGGCLILSLYQGWSSRIVALNLNWYRQHLSVLGFRDFHVVSLRRSHDAVIAR